MRASRKFMTVKRAGYLAAMAAAPLALATVGTTPAHALCYGAPGKAGEYDGYTSQGQATGPNGTDLAPRRVWVYREPQRTRSDCKTPVIVVFEWRDGRSSGYARGCPLNTVKGAFYAYGTANFENSSGAVAKTLQYTRGGTYHFASFSGFFNRTDKNAIKGAVRGGYGPSSSHYTCFSSSIGFTAKWRAGVSGVFKPGNLGYAVKQDFDKHHPEPVTESCTTDTCTTSEP